MIISVQDQHCPKVTIYSFRDVGLGMVTGTTVVSDAEGVTAVSKQSTGRIGNLNRQKDTRLAKPGEYFPAFFSYLLGRELTQGMQIDQLVEVVGDY